MKRLLIIPIFLCLISNIVAAQDMTYRRSSLYSLLLNHTNQNYASEIKDVFCSMPVPDKYNDHDLSVKIIEVDNKRIAVDSITKFLTNQHVANRLVARWFEMDPFTGAQSMDLIKLRGLYNASTFDRMLAQKSLRGNALLEDAGEDLIQNTFVIVNDIVYIDKERQGHIAGLVLKMMFVAFGAVTAGMSGDVGQMESAMNTGNQMDQLMKTLKGFKVQVTTHLYQLEWDEQKATEYYEHVYSDTPSEAGKEYFANHPDMFSLKYIGSQSSSGKDVSFIGVNLSTPDEMIRKACTRAIDENVANLAKNFEQFKVKVKISNANPIQAPIGMKEEISENSRFEVLQQTEINGKTAYKRVAVVKPVKGKIWDNRFMAEEERAAQSTIQNTTFTKISGAAILPGMLLREIREK